MGQTRLQCPIPPKSDSAIKGVTNLDLWLDELGEYASEIWKVLVLLRENRFELKQNAVELREDRKMKRSPRFIRAAERDRLRLIYVRKCLQARIELLEAGKRRDTTRARA